MSELPEGWCGATVADIAERVTKGTTPTTLGFAYTASGIRFVKVESLEHMKVRHDRCAFIAIEADAELKRSRLRARDVLFSIAGTLGRVAVVSEEDLPANTNQAVAIVRPTAAADSSFLALALHHGTTAGHAVDGGRGVGLQNLNLQQLSEVRLDLPPVAEQRRIVAKLEDLLARSRRAKAALDAVPPLLEKLRQSVLAAAFRGDLTADWRAKNPDVEPAETLLARIRVERRKKWEEAELAKMKAKGKAPTDDRWKQKYVEPEPVDASELPELPEGWCWASVEELSTRVTDGTHQPPTFTATGVPFIVIANVKSGAIDWSSVSKWVSRATYEENTARCVPERGDVLYTAVGSYGLALTVDTDEPFMFQRHIAHIKPRSQHIRPEVLAIMLNAPQSKARADEVARGVAQKTVTLGEICQFPIPVAPAPEQQRLLGVVGDLLQVVEKRQRELSAVRGLLVQSDRAVLAKAFRGELVPQDPNDEPAEVMLARLKAHRGEDDGVKPRRRGRTG